MIEVLQVERDTKSTMVVGNVRKCTVREGDILGDMIKGDMINSAQSHPH